MNYAQWLACCPIRRWRMAQRPPWSAARLAREANIGRMTLYTWEHGRMMPKIDTWMLIQAVTNLSALEYLRWYEQNPDTDGENHHDDTEIETPA